VFNCAIAFDGTGTPVVVDGVRTSEGTSTWRNWLCRKNKPSR
jgi:hypothetical protein